MDQRSSLSRELLLPLLITIFGGIIVAWYIQEGKRFEPPPTPAPVPPTNTAREPLGFCAERKEVGSGWELVAVIVRTDDPTQFTVHNELLTPIKVEFGIGWSERIEARNTADLRPNSFPVDISWQVIRQINSSGIPIGEPMGNSITAVGPADWVDVSKLVDGGYFFYPIITNNLDDNCEVSINDGLAYEIRPCIIPARAQSIGIGYYRWYPKSNVTLYCDQERIQKDLPPTVKEGTPPYDHTVEGAILITVGEP